MKQNKNYKIDLWLFIASLATFAYILFMNVANKYQWDQQTVLGGIMEFITIPIFFIGSLIPLIVVFRFISKKIENRTLAMFTIFFSLLTALLIGYVSSSTV